MVTNTESLCPFLLLRLDMVPDSSNLFFLDMIAANLELSQNMLVNTALQARAENRTCNSVLGLWFL